MKSVKENLDAVVDKRRPPKTVDGKIPIEFGVTHVDEDHIDGIDALQPRYEIQSVTQPDDKRFEISDANTGKPKGGVGHKIIESYVDGLEEHGMGLNEINQVSEGDSIPIDADTEIDVLAPPVDDDSVAVTRASTGADVSLPPIRSNENGAVFKLDSERSALFMGDMQDKSDHYGESWLIQQHDDPESEVDLNADVLFVAHHGSANATSTEFLERVDPEMAVISSDFAKQHGHPHDEVLKNLHDNDVAVSWTAGHGTTRVDLNDALSTERTTDLETTNAADLAALKYYCREHDVSPEHIRALTPDHLPEETSAWVAESAPMMVETTEEIVNTAIENAESVEDLRQTLDPTPDAHDQLREGVEADRDEHVTTKKDVKRNREAYFSSVRKERAYKQLPLHTRFRTKLPTRFGAIENPLADVPSSDDIDGPRKVEEIPRAVQHSPAAEQRANEGIVIDRQLLAAEDAADSAVDTAKTSKTLCHRLRDTPGAHQDFLYAIETPDAHNTNKPEEDVSESREPTNQRERTQKQDISLG